MSSETETILEAARRTSDILCLNGFCPTAVSWQDVEHPGTKGARVVTPHFPVLEDTILIISPVLQGRVAAEDWGPILAPSLIFYRQLKKRYNIGALIRILPALLLFLGFLIFSYLFVPRPSNEIVVGVVVGTVVFLVLGVYDSIRLGRSFVLKADREVALVIG